MAHRVLSVALLVAPITALSYDPARSLAPLHRLLLQRTVQTQTVYLTDFHDEAKAQWLANYLDPQAPVWKSNCGRPMLRSCVCAMAWRFHAIDAMLSPWPRRLDGVEAHEGPRKIT